jgi:hypothetical protein
MWRPSSRRKRRAATGLSATSPTRRCGGGWKAGARPGGGPSNGGFRWPVSRSSSRMWRAHCTVILVDANLLLYAYHPRAEQHEESQAWLEAVLSEPDLVRFGWLALWPSSDCNKSPRVRTPAIHNRSRSGDFFLARSAGPWGFPIRANGAGTSCAVLCATDRLPARWSWTPSSPRSRWSMAPRSARQVATSRGFPGSGGRTLSQRTVDRTRHYVPLDENI